MRNRVWIALLLGLTGCVSVAERSERDHAMCLEWGAESGTDAYVACRATIYAARKQAGAAIAAGAIASP